jgi:hypothetical protein
MNNGVVAGTNAGGNGDRLPTRERGYRSANQYVRRRAAMPAGINNGIVGEGNPGVSEEEEGLGPPVDLRAIGSHHIAPL